MKAGNIVKAKAAKKTTEGAGRGFCSFTFWRIE